MLSVSEGKNILLGQRKELHDLRHRFLKLCWMGQEDEAEKLLVTQRSKGVSVVVIPDELTTD
jgi:hypothetical protein